jgi:hypothetical protein
MKTENPIIVLLVLLGSLWVLTSLSQIGCTSSNQGEGEMDTKSLSGVARDELEFYASHSIMTDSGEYAYLFEDLPSEISELRDIVQGLLIHVFHAHRYAVELTDERKVEVGIRRVEEMLARIMELDDQPLTRTRPPNKRLTGNCRDFSVLTCSLLRHSGIPARVRCGFSTCLNPEKYEDHWILEYWNAKEGRWVQVDPQLDSLLVRVLSVDYDPLDMPEGKFLTGSEVWTLCRVGQVDPDLCGIGDTKGLWFVAEDALRDLMALNKIEVLAWDCNELMGSIGEGFTEAHYALLDSIAELAPGHTIRFSEARALYKSNPSLRMPEDWKP